MPGRSPSEEGLVLPESHRLSAHQAAKPRRKAAVFGQNNDSSGELRCD
jgi:hypothetical protein